MTSLNQVGAKIRAGVTRSLFGGVKVNGNIHGARMLSAKVTGAVRHRLSVSDSNTTFRCNLSTCEDTSLCGP